MMTSLLCVHDGFAQTTKIQKEPSVYSNLQFLNHRNTAYHVPKKSTILLESQESNNIIRHIFQNTSISGSMSFPLKYINDNTASDKPSVYNRSASLNARYSYKNFFFDVGLTKFAHRQPWNSDFSYALGYNDWRMNTFSFQYANYSPNRIKPGQGERISRPENGTFSLGYKFLYPNFMSQLINSQNKLNGSIGLAVTPKYYNTIEEKKKHLKYTASIGAFFQPITNLNAGIILFYYIKKEPQAAWEPDFAYTLSYSMPISYGNITISYQNYSGTRYPWRKNHRNFLAFRDGSIGIAFSANLDDLLYKTKRKK